MTRDELEFSISQYLDGTLADAERNALDERLATDAEARAILGEYESLQRALVADALPLVNWDALSNRISAAVSGEEMPAQSYKISQWFSPARLAIAASALIAAGIGFSVLRDRSTSGPEIAVQPISIVVTTPVSQPVQVTSDPIRVAIGPSPTLRDEPVILRYADTVVQRSSKALIVSAAPAAQDTLLAPF